MWLALPKYHEGKTKEITTTKEVCKCDLNYHKICELLLWISPRNINGFWSYIKHSKECLIRFPNTSELVKNKKLGEIGFKKRKHSPLCLLYYMKREELLPSNASVILQICENDAPLAQANTTSIIWGLKDSTYVSTSISSLASSETFPIRRADS